MNNSSKIKLNKSTSSSSRYHPSDQQYQLNQDDIFDYRYTAYHYTDKILNEITRRIYQSEALNLVKELLEIISNFNTKPSKNIKLTFIRTNLSNNDREVILNSILKTLINVLNNNKSNNFEDYFISYSSFNLLFEDSLSNSLSSNNNNINLLKNKNQFFNDIIYNLLDNKLIELKLNHLLNDPKFSLHYFNDNLRNKDPLKFLETILTALYDPSLLEYIPNNIDDNNIENNKKKYEKINNKKKLFILILPFAENLPSRILNDIIKTLKNQPCSTLIICGCLSSSQLGIDCIPSYNIKNNFSSLLSSQYNTEVSFLETESPYNLYDNLMQEIVSNDLLPVQIHPGVLKYLNNNFFNDTLCISSLIKKIQQYLSEHFRYRSSILSLSFQPKWLISMNITQMKLNLIIKKLLGYLDQDDIFCGIKLNLNPLYIKNEKKIKNNNEESSLHVDEVNATIDAILLNKEFFILMKSIYSILILFRNYVLKNKYKEIQLIYSTTIIWANLIENGNLIQAMFQEICNEIPNLQASKLKGVCNIIQQNVRSPWNIYYNNLENDNNNTEKIDGNDNNTANNKRSISKREENNNTNSVQLNSLSILNSFRNILLQSNDFSILFNNIEEDIFDGNIKCLDYSLSSMKEYIKKTKTDEDFDEELHASLTSGLEIYESMVLELIEWLQLLGNQYGIMRNTFCPSCSTKINKLYKKNNINEVNSNTSTFNDVCVCTMPGVYVLPSSALPRLNQKWNSNFRSRYMDSIINPNNHLPNNYKSYVIKNENINKKEDDEETKKRKNLFYYEDIKFILNKINYSQPKEIASIWFDEFSQLNTIKKLDNIIEKKIRFAHALRHFETLGVINIFTNNDGVIYINKNLYGGF